jgi:hypothetical protein
MAAATAESGYRRKYGIVAAQHQRRGQRQRKRSVAGGLMAYMASAARNISRAALSVSAASLAIMAAQYAHHIEKRSMALMAAA